MPQRNGLEFYKSGKNVRWRVWKNGKIKDASSECFTRLRNAVNNYMSGLIPSDVKKAIAEFKKKIQR